MRLVGATGTGNYVRRSLSLALSLRLDPIASSPTFKSRVMIPDLQRQTPPIVSANSPTPDEEDYFAEDTVQLYHTEDTPYNKSTATSLSDLSVIDDDDDDANYIPGLCVPIGLIKHIDPF